MWLLWMLVTLGVLSVGGYHWLKWAMARRAAFLNQYHPRSPKACPKGPFQVYCESRPLRSWSDDIYQAVYVILDQIRLLDNPRDGSLVGTQFLGKNQELALLAYNLRDGRRTYYLYVVNLKRGTVTTCGRSFTHTRCAFWEVVSDASGYKVILLDQGEVPQEFKL